MKIQRILAAALCLLLLAGCGLTPREEAAESPIATAQRDRPEEAVGGDALPDETAEPEAPADKEAASEQADGETEEGPAAAPEPTPEPTPAGIVLSGGAFPEDTEELKAVVTAEDLALLEGFTSLQRADLRGSECRREIAAWAIEHPEVRVICEAELSDGTVLAADTKELTLSDCVPGEDLRALAVLRELKTVELGECADAAESPLDWEALAAAEQALPETEFHYAFTLYKKHFDLQSTEMDLNHIAMTDEGALVKKVAACLPGLTLLDMDFCHVSDEAMAQIRDSLPETEVVWRIWFGDNRTSGYSVRTNVTKILASNPGISGELTPENTTGLKYCTKVRFLDLGHNDQLTDISFVSCMPDLEVAVLSMGGFRDLSPLADCPKLEYLELFTGAVSDLRPLAGLKNLRHLNLAWCFALTDITPLYELTELERLWLGRFDPVPREQIEEMQRRAPNCEINITTGNPTEEGWRYIGHDEWGYSIAHPRYALLRKQFEYGSAPYCYSYIPYDPLYYPHG